MRLVLFYGLWVRDGSEYVYRMWGGRVAIEDITQGLTELRKKGFIEMKG